METISFDRLLLKTAFCCMASDGNINKKEVAIIKKLCEITVLLKNIFDRTEKNNYT